jgi:hypothetical protein
VNVFLFELRLSQKGETALIAAAGGGHRIIVRELVVRRANINQSDEVSALHVHVLINRLRIPN